MERKKFISDETIDKAAKYGRKALNNCGQIALDYSKIASKYGKEALDDCSKIASKYSKKALEYNYRKKGLEYSQKASESRNEFCALDLVKKIKKNMPLCMLLIYLHFCILVYSIYLLQLKDEEGNSPYRFQGTFFLSISIVYLIFLIIIFSCDD